MRISLSSFLLVLLISSCYHLRLEAAGFIPNKGQIKNTNGEVSDALYVLSLKGMNVFFYEDKMAYEVHHYPNDLEWSEELREIPLVINRLEVLFKGASADCSLLSVRAGKEKRRFIGPGLNIETELQEELIYKGLFDGVDLKLKLNEDGNFEYDFIVDSPELIDKIQLEYHGQQSIELCEDKICLDLGEVQINESIPSSYFKTDTSPVHIAYSLQGNVVSFSHELSPETKGEVVIDPTPELVYASYYGGELTDYMHGSCVDLNGSPYSVGSTFSISNISTEGAFQTELALGRDIIITKWNTTGGIEWSTYWGGEGYEESLAIECQSDQLYILASTDSEDMATEGAYQSETGVGILTSLIGSFTVGDGNLLWSTYYSEANDFFWSLSDIAISSSGDLITVGRSTQPELPVSNNPLQAELNGEEDGLIIVWNNQGQAIYSSHFGGTTTTNGISEKDQFRKVIALENGSLIIAGETTTIDFPTSTDANQPDWQGESDIALVQLSSSFELEYSSYLGTSSADIPLLLKYDQESNRLLVAGSLGAEILTADAHLTSTQSPYVFAILDEEYFVDYASFIAGEPSGAEWANDGLLISGQTIYEEGVSTDDAWRSELASNGIEEMSQDLFLQVYSLDGELNFGTYFGDCSIENGGYLEQIDGQFFIFGSSFNTENLEPNCELPFTTPDAEQATNNGNADNFIAIFDLVTGIPELQTINTTNAFSFGPNPLPKGQSLNLFNSRDFSSNAQYEILSADGRLIASISAGYADLTTFWSLPELSSGVYVLQLKEEGRIVQSEKLMVE